MSGFLLTPAERYQFVDYCRREAESLDMMAKQMESTPIGAFVARDLEKVEDVSIDPKDVGGAPHG